MSRKKKVNIHAVGAERRKELAALPLSERWKREQRRLENRTLVIDRTSERGCNLWLTASRLAKRLEEGSIKLIDGYYYVV